MSDKTFPTPEPEPGRAAGEHPTPGERGGSGVPPLETPPVEGSTSGAGPRETYNPSRGWAVGPLIVVALIVVVFAGYFIARIFVT
ncbi:DUF6480 family protein [Streptomyces sp. GSL17-111]|uniref:DUF6480 family protein n=1 Tax=Streptomyces sp. GSL17-111 TaxID=3121596 RepID=UPI0030F4688E